MAIYEYQYRDGAGKTRTVERFFRIGEAPATVTVTEHGQEVQAKRVMSLTAKMGSQWDSYEPSDLPPTNAPIVGR
jgi:hypothetical protein